MLPIIPLKDISPDNLSTLFFRFGDDFSTIMTETVAPIVRDVKLRGDAAVRDYSEKFDKFRPEALIASDAEIEQGYRETPKEVIASIEAAAANIREFHEKQLPGDFSYTRGDGSTLGLCSHPLDAAAVYVPGGKAAYPSTVLMGIIPAQIAGVPQITLISPPRDGGRVSAAVAAACRVLGVQTVLKAGGAHGIAAAGLGTESVPKSDLIVGPGNIYVTAAKSYLFSLGVIQIDSLAGPSEVLIIADHCADPKWLAWDLLSQAEHEENAEAVLLTDSEELAHAVREHIVEDIESGRGRSEIKRKSITAHARIILTKNIDEAVEFSNRYAPEHMQMMVSDPMPYLPRIRNVGSLFLGYHAPVAAGDYFSGTNHVLPTGGAARFSSGLSVETFRRRMTWQRLSEEGLRAAEPHISVLSDSEGFGDKHGGSVRIRFSC